MGFAGKKQKHCWSSFSRCAVVPFCMKKATRLHEAAAFVDMELKAQIYEETRGNIWFKGGLSFRIYKFSFISSIFLCSCLPILIFLLLSFYSYLLTPMPSVTAMFRHCMLWFTSRKGKVLYFSFMLLYVPNVSFVYETGKCHFYKMLHFAWWLTWI